MVPSYERTARAAVTGLTEHQRDQLCFDLRRRGWSLRRIGAHPNVQMSHVSVKHAIERVAVFRGLGVVLAGAPVVMRRGRLRN
jgi:hypothetical protein